MYNCILTAVEYIKLCLVSTSYCFNLWVKGAFYLFIVGFLAKEPWQKAAQSANIQPLSISGRKKWGGERPEKKKESGENRVNKYMRKLAQKEKKVLFHSHVWIWRENQFGKILLGKFNIVFIAPCVCIGSKYYQLASRTTNNTIPLLMTEMKPTLVNIIQFHPCTVCSEKMSNAISTG